MSAPTYDLGKLHGGLRLAAEKTASTERAIVEVPIPAQLVMPITQHVGDPAQPVVGIGERVLRGQLIAEPDGTLGAPVHASSSGKIVAIEPWPVARRLGDNAPCIVIECDGRDEAVQAVEALPDFLTMTPEHLLGKVLQGGIVGLGGAVFPTAQKLMQARTSTIDHLLLNGVECEPYISCDDMLMRERATEVIDGARILMHALQIDVCFLVVESDKPEAIRALSEVLGAIDDNLNGKRIVIKQVPTIYPSGGEDQLVQLVTHREVPSGGLPSDVGCLVQNVGTAAAIHDWIVGGEPLISRITTVTGDGVASPVNVRARIGTTIADIVGLAGGYTERAQQLIIGGPMTGKSVTTDRVPLEKATNCILISSETPAPGPELPCIRCGDCAAVCPVQLLPQQLFWYACADDENKLREFGLTDCIECGCCDLVCPSHIPLTADFRVAKGRIRELADEKARALRARQRFEARNERLEREQGGAETRNSPGRKAEAKAGRPGRYSRDPQAQTAAERGRRLVEFKRREAPFLSPQASVSSLMLQVLAALVPAALAHVWYFGPGFIFNLLVADAFCGRRRRRSMLSLRSRSPESTGLTDYSALVTAALLAFALPSLTPWWVTATGALFAVVVAKHLYGGLGFNLFNPAMAGYVVILVAFPMHLNLWVAPQMGDLDYQHLTILQTLGFTLTGNAARRRYVRCHQPRDTARRHEIRSQQRAHDRAKSAHTDHGRLRRPRLGVDRQFSGHWRFLAADQKDHSLADSGRRRHGAAGSRHDHVPGRARQSNASPGFHLFGGGNDSLRLLHRHRPGVGRNQSEGPHYLRAGHRLPDLLHTPLGQLRRRRGVRRAADEHGGARNRLPDPAAHRRPRLS